LKAALIGMSEYLNYREITDGILLLFLTVGGRRLSKPIMTVHCSDFIQYSSRPIQNETGRRIDGIELWSYSPATFAQR